MSAEEPVAGGAAGRSGRARLLVAGVVAALSLGAAACGGDDTAEAEPEDASPSSTDAPSATISEAPESTTTSQAPALATSTTTTAVETVTFDSLVDPERGIVDGVCFDALVEEGEILGIDQGDGYLSDGLGLQIQTGSVSVPGFAEALETSGLDDPRTFLDLVAPVCEQIGWTP